MPREKRTHSPSEHQELAIECGQKKIPSSGTPELRIQISFWRFLAGLIIGVGDRSNPKIDSFACGKGDRL
jgi:hypothetical protein